MPNFCPGCGVRWTPEHACDVNAGYYEITSADVGKRFLEAFGKTWPLSDVMGYVQRIDVGKRIYRVRDSADVRDFLQVENNEQRDARLSQT